MVIDMYGESKLKIRERRQNAAKQVNQIKNRILVKEAWNKMIQATNDLWRKEEAINRKLGASSLADRTLRQQVFLQWKDTHALVVHQNKQHIKAIQFHRNNQQIHLKLVLFYMRKILTK